MEEYQFAIIRESDNVLLALENDYETARMTALENNSPLYILDYPFTKDMVGTAITNGSYRQKVCLKDLYREDSRQLSFDF